MGNVLDKNLLVVSDLHLGEDLRPGGASVSYLRHLVRLERELEKFLFYYTRNRVGERPWRLVVNGDMVDFMSVKILPDGNDLEPGAHDPRDDDRLYGLGFGEEQSQQKLEKVILRHQSVFAELARFVAAGNDLVIVVGNHDVEFQYDAVQETLVSSLWGLAFGLGAADELRASFCSRIQFCPWFYYHEGLIYIEHGHQYDEYCSFDYLLHPIVRRQGGQKSGLALSIAHAGMRYFANQLPNYDPHTAEHWKFLNYMRWLWAQGLRGAIRVSYLYGLFVWRVVEIWYALGSADAERRTMHLERLRGLSRRWQIAEDRLMALDRLRRVPVTRRFFGLIGALFIDRVLLGALMMMACALASVCLKGWWRVGAPVATVASTLGMSELLNILRLETCAAKLRQVPRLIQRLVKAPFIVFGHSHNPEMVSLEGGATYFNTGTWASADDTHAFTHLLVTTSRGASPQAELRQWKDGSSAPYKIRSSRSDKVEAL
jgi:UDP-2,3-diacylglucosamine pyrophosphatase LpxH